MNNKNFLLGFMATQQQQQIKGKNPNSFSKILKSKPYPALAKQKQEKKSIESSGNLTESNHKNSRAVKQIEKLQRQLQVVSKNIQVTEKKLDTDLFLKKQKQKRQQYARNLNQQYELQKKKRQEMLYNKYRGDRNAQDRNRESMEHTKNIKTGVPIELIKILELQNNSISKSKTIINGHHHTLQTLIEDRKIITYPQIVQEEKQLLFIQNPHETQNSQNSLKSLKQIAANMLNVQYFPIDFSKPSLELIQQYQNVISALTLMPNHLSSKLFSFKQIEGNNYFLGKMFLNGQRKSVLCSDLIETRQFAHYHVNLHSKMSDNRNFGPTIVQKCFRKVSANLEYPDLNFSIYTLFGVNPEIIRINNRNYIKQNFQTILKWLLSSGQIIGFMNNNGHNSSIFEDRLYRLKQIAEAVQLPPQQLNQTKKNKHKKQANEQMLNKVQASRKNIYYFQNPYKGTVLDSKGLNKFQLLEVFEKFNNLILVRDYPKNWICKRINLELFSLGPLSMTNNQWTKNNQYHFSITSPLNIKIVMHKVQVSSAQSIVKAQSQKNQDQETNNLYGFFIFHCKQGEQKITCLKLDSLVVKTKSNDSLQWPSYTQRLQKGNYIIIPYSNKVTKKCFQLFNLDFFIEKNEHLQFGKAVINYWKWDKQTHHGHSQKIIQSLQSREQVQKTKIQEVEITKISPQGSNPQKLFESIPKDQIFVPKGFNLKDILIPGKLIKFLINSDVEIISKPQKSAGKNKRPTKNQKKTVLTKNQQIQSLQKEQALKTLLGYDILEGQDINRGLMMQQMEKNEQIFDLAHYGLGSEGLTGLIETLMQRVSIKKLDLSDNQLDDLSIVYLCYYLDKANRVQLQELNLKDNCFGNIGLHAIRGIMARYKNLQVSY